MKRGILKRVVSAAMIIALIFSFTVFIASAEETAYKNSLRNQGFPELYIEKLWQMHRQHPNWTFKAYITGLDWDTAVAAESAERKNLVYINPNGASATRLYRSHSVGEYSAKTGFDYDYVVRDGNDSAQTGWVDATSMAVAYYMNPYSFIGDDMTILQFESLEWNFTSVNEAEAVVEMMLSGTFMSKTRNSYNSNYIDDNGHIIYKNTSGRSVTTDTTYANAICTSAKNNNINPCYLASKIMGEVGKTGESGSVTGTYSGYVGYYNYLNIGASDSSTGGAVANGLSKAKKEGWTSPQAAIDGGAKFIAQRYIAAGQNTSYLQKFNVTSKNTYNNQYMTAVNGVVSTTYNTYTGYENYGILDSKKTFYIPVFKNMPNGSSSAIFGSYDNTGVVNESGVKLRSGAGTNTDSNGYVEKNKTYTVYGGYRNQTVTATRYRMYYPLWYNINGGYVCEDFLDVNASRTLSVGSSMTFAYSLKNGNETPRFMSWDTRIASVDSSGKITAKKIGTTKIIAYLSNGSFAVLNIAVTSSSSGIPSSLTSSKHSINNSSSYIGKINAGTTVSAFKNAINEKAYLKITKNGTTLNDSDTVTTGCVVSIMNGNSTVRSYYTIVTGDINVNNGVGDGKISITDLLAIRDHLLASNGKLTGVNYKAADVNGDGKVSITDLLEIRDYLLGTHSITPRAY